MLPTPQVSTSVPPYIYPPSEDSFLLLDAVAEDAPFLSSRFPSSTTPSPLHLDVGTGSGIAVAFTTANAVAILGRRDVLTMATDINPWAGVTARGTVLATVGEAVANTSRLEAELRAKLGCGLYLASLTADLAGPLRQGQVDILTFNPPYVPTDELPDVTPLVEMAVDGQATSNLAPSPADRGWPDYAMESRLLALATDGGTDGMELTDRLLDDLEHIMSPRGVAYILLCKRNKVAKVVEKAEGWGRGSNEDHASSISKRNWHATVIRESGKTGGWEKLVILRISRAVASEL